MVSAAIRWAERILRKIESQAMFSAEPSPGGQLLRANFRERSSGGKQRLGAINKQGNSLMRTLLVESAQSVTRLDPGFRKQYLHRCRRMAKGVAKVAAARGLAVRLFWMLRTNTEYPEIVHIESSPTLAVVSES